jgi:hypothetical protein
MSCRVLVSRARARVFQATLTALLMLLGVAGAAAECENNKGSNDFEHLDDFAEDSEAVWNCRRYRRSPLNIIYRKLVRAISPNVQPWASDGNRDRKS